MEKVGGNQKYRKQVVRGSTFSQGQALPPSPPHRALPPGFLFHYSLARDLRLMGWMGVVRAGDEGRDMGEVDRQGGPPTILQTSQPQLPGPEVSWGFFLLCQSLTEAQEIIESELCSSPSLMQCVCGEALG